ncbi:hypothetical protein OJAV_G00123100 [Oryzias javanicus]|uniref:Uncharacterized protein n=1 Tax=Oryzias javanicus TaxID=123683 RepID=A0A3S2P3X2_ORYJA|nr:hypothetical protein OJAV_G00123100 [Oryzias javanicus]
MWTLSSGVAQPIRWGAGLREEGRWEGCEGGIKNWEKAAGKPKLQGSWTMRRPMETGVSDVTPAGWLTHDHLNTM